MTKTRIEWATHTWNPVTGCSPVSDGCQNCYAERMSKRLAGRYGYPKDEPFKITFHEDRLEQPFRWWKPRQVFVCSMGDLFHKDVPFELVDQVFEIMALCQEHTFLVLTKRPHRMKEWADTISDRRPIRGQGVCTGGSPFCMGSYCKTHDSDVGYCGSPWPLPNVWLGVTAENQEMADKRIPILLETPAVKRFVSVEPMLGPVYLNQIRTGNKAITLNVLTGTPYDWDYDEWVPEDNIGARIDWVICGCESGPKRRSMNIDWARNLKNQCVDANVPFFLKQMDVDGKVVKMPELDGQVWNERPKEE